VFGSPRNLRKFIFRIFDAEPVRMNRDIQCSAIKSRKVQTTIFEKWGLHFDRASRIVLRCFRSNSMPAHDGSLDSYNAHCNIADFLELLNAYREAEDPAHVYHTIEQVRVEDIFPIGSDRRLNSTAYLFLVAMYLKRLS